MLVERKSDQQPGRKREIELHHATQTVFSHGYRTPSPPSRWPRGHPRPVVVRHQFRSPCRRDQSSGRRAGPTLTPPGSHQQHRLCPGHHNLDAHSGTQSWLLSNAFNDDTVATISSPHLRHAPVGETNTVRRNAHIIMYSANRSGFAALQHPPIRALRQSIPLEPLPSVRNTVSASPRTAATSSLTPSAAPTFPPPAVARISTAALVRAYQVKIDATFIDGPDNDQVRLSGVLTRPAT